jgi:hypothetical protein
MFKLERNDLLRHATSISRGKQMGTKNKKKLKKLDLLEMPTPERIKLIKEVKENLRQKMAEAKLWQSLLEAENLTINGKTVCKEDEQLSRFCFDNKI